MNFENDIRDIPRIEESFCQAWEEGGGVPEGEKMSLQWSYKAWTLELWCLILKYLRNEAKTMSLFCTSSLSLSDNKCCNFEGILFLFLFTVAGAERRMKNSSSIFIFFLNKILPISPVSLPLVFLPPPEKNFFFREKNCR